MVTNIDFNSFELEIWCVLSSSEGKNDIERGDPVLVV